MICLYVYYRQQVSPTGGYEVSNLNYRSEFINLLGDDTSSPIADRKPSPLSDIQYLISNLDSSLTPMKNMKILSSKIYNNIYI